MEKKISGFEPEIQDEITQLQNTGNFGLEDLANFEAQDAEIKKLKSFDQFDKEAKAQHAQTAQELEQQKVQAEIELKMAIKAHGEDDEPRYSDGKEIPRQFRGTWGQNNPQLKQEFDRQRAEKTSALQAAQNAHASAVDAHQTHISTPPPTSADLNTIGQSAPQAQQPTQQQPAPQQQPVSQQPDQNSEQRRKKEQDEMRKRMNAVAAENGAPNNA